MEIEPRIGTGFDAHRLVAGRPLMLGGVEVPSERGADGHSDADVACHALIDAIFGALADGDIGSHFPDTDPRFKDISSLQLLEAAADSVLQRGFKIASADVTIILETPKVASLRNAMRHAMAKAMITDVTRVGVKATTTEGMGFTGRGEGVAAQAVVLLVPALEGKAP